MSSHSKHPPGAAPAVTWVEVLGGRPVTFSNSELAADFIIHHFSEIAKVHSAPRPMLPKAPESGPGCTGDTDE